jgi:hypothetical protein
MIASMIPSSRLSVEVSLRAVAAERVVCSLACFQRIAAHPSGLMTLYQAYLEHRDAVGDGDAERAARATLADHDRDDRDRNPAHLAEVDGDRLGLPRSSAPRPG